MNAFRMQNFVFLFNTDSAAEGIEIALLERKSFSKLDELLYSTGEYKKLGDQDYNVETVVCSILSHSTYTFLLKDLVQEMYRKG